MGDFWKNAGKFVVEHSPEILTGIGVLSGIGAIACAIKETPKAQEDLAKAKTKIAEKRIELHENGTPKNVCGKELSKMYMKEYGKVAMDYKGTMTCGLISGASSIGSTVISVKRNTELTTKYNNAVTAASMAAATLASYRNNVVNDAGEEKDMQYLTGAEKVEKIEVPVANDDGEVVDTVEVFKIDTNIDENNPLFDGKTIKLDGSNWWVWRTYDGNMGAITGWLKSMMETWTVMELSKRGKITLEDFIRNGLDIDVEEFENFDIGVMSAYSWFSNPFDENCPSPNYIACDIAFDANNALYLTFNCVLGGDRYLHDHREEVVGEAAIAARERAIPDTALIYDASSVLNISEQ